MDNPLVIPPGVFEQALKAGRTANERRAATEGLAAPLGGAILGKVAAIWDKVEAAFVAAHRFGVDRAAELRDAAITASEQALEEAGAQAAQLHAALLARIQGYGSELVAGAIASLEDTVTVGGTTLALADVSLSRKIVLTGSLKASITEMVSLTGSGEITVAARYDR